MSFVSRAYLDWAAGAPLHPVARDALARSLSLGAGNPASVHGAGRAARAVLERAREQVARLVGCEPREVIFTGSATEANAAAVLGVARKALAASAGGATAAGGSEASARLLVGATEHPSVLQAAAAAAREGAAVQTLPCSPEGVVAPASVRAAGGAALVAMQLANNELGVVQPLAAVAAAAREAGAHLHCDAVQAAGKLPLDDVWARCDSLALSAHKLGGLPGVGALVLRRGVELPALVPGHQERGFRGGTPALPSIAAFGAVAELASSQRQARVEALRLRTEQLEALLRGVAPDVVIHGGDAKRVPGIVNARFPGVDGETLLVGLDLAGVACSHGAACSTGAMEPSHVLLAMGLGAEQARSTVRFSLGPTTTELELALLAEALPGALRSARLAAA